MSKGRHYSWSRSRTDLVPGYSSLFSSLCQTRSLFTDFLVIFYCLRS